MEKELKIRLAQEKDIEAMVALISLVFSLEKDFAADVEKQRSGLALLLNAAERACLVVAEIDGAVMAMCSAQLLVSTAEGGWKAIIEDVAVDEAYRGRGIGRRLLAYVEEWAQKHDVKRLDLLADRDNKKGLAFYGRMQWRKTNLVALQKSGG